jgi:hypothetical protein
MSGLIAYATVVGVAVAAYLGINWSALLIGAAVLTLISMLEQRRFRPRLAEIGMVEMLYTAGMGNLGNSILAALAAYFLGAGTRILFGS